MFKVLFLTGIALLIPLFFILMFMASAYHRLAGLRTRLRAACSQLEIELDRRADLISGIVDIAMSGFREEPDLFRVMLVGLKGAVATRFKDAQISGDARAMEGLALAESALRASLAQLRLRIEAHPALEASLALQERFQELTAAETRVTSARLAYKDAVMGYNNSRRAFPNNLIAAMMKFTPVIPFVS